LGRTKSGKRRGEREHVILDDPVLVSRLRQHVHGRALSETLWPATGAAFRRAFSSLCSQVPGNWKPYSLRRGGATHDYVMLRNLPALMIRGRWQNQQTARLYVSESVNEIGRVRLPPAVRKSLSRWEAVLFT
jgi:hypothetical protein